MQQANGRTHRDILTDLKLKTYLDSKVINGCELRYQIFQFLTNIELRLSLMRENEKKFKH